MAAPKRKIITLECTECKERNYSTEKNLIASVVSDIPKII